MESAEGKTVRCFICRSKGARCDTNYMSIEKLVKPDSKKPLKTVLVHLAKFIKTELKLPSDAIVCLLCYRDVVEYEDFVLKLLEVRKRLKLKMLEVQRRLTEMMKNALSVCDKSPASSSDDEEYKVEWMASEENHDETAAYEVDVPDAENYEEELTLADIKASLGQIDEKEISLHSEDIKLEIEKDVEEDEEELKVPNKKDEVRRFRKKDKRPICTVCGMKLKDEDYLDLHMNLHEGKTETECRYCDKRFTCKPNVLRHMQVHWDKKKFQCDKCGLCFKQQIVLWNHKQHHEAEKQPPRCETCGMVFKTRRTLRYHLITHRPDRPRYGCEYCDKTFVEKYTLKVHKRTTHPEEATTSEQKQLRPKHHQQQPQEEDAAEPQLNCIICDLQFTNKDTLDKHMEREHDVITPLTITDFSQYEVVEHEPKKRAKTSRDKGLKQKQGVCVLYLQ